MKIYINPMKKLFLLLAIFALAGTSCEDIKKTDSPPEESQVILEKPEHQQATPEPELKEKVSVEQRKEEPLTEVTPEPSAELSLYKGYWFDIEYPSDFDFEPKELVNYHEGVRMILTDQAWFTSPDGEVEFYVYSPLWRGTPEYLDILETEELVSEESSRKEREVNGFFYTDSVTWRTIKAKDGSYTRSYAYHENDVYEPGSGTSHVFGIKYANQAAYNKYREVYKQFKSSLQQYAD